MIPPTPAVLKDKEFKRFSALIYDKAGIMLPPAKKTMLEARLQKRLRFLGLPNFEAYADYVFNSVNQIDELVHLIDVVTTNKTDFFREPDHFDYLTKTALPTIIAAHGDCIRKPVHIWSAGCASGEEPYTLAMVLMELAEKRRDFRYTIFASDISTKVLDQAITAIYPAARAEPIPERFKKKYLMYCKDRTNPLVRICPEIRALVNFGQVNFMDDDLGVRQKMDIIFCRNVVIYFDKNTQQTLMGKFHHQLKDGGYLFLGHSESMSGLEVDFKSVASTVYRKP